MSEHSRCRCKNDLPAAGRIVVVKVAINWGADDARADWTGEKSFCSFACLKDWAEDMSVNHDGRTV